MADEWTEKCEICGLEFKNLSAHVRAKHKMTMDEYKEAIKDDDDFSEMEEAVAKVVVTKEVVEDPVVDEVVDKPVVNKMNIKITENSTVSNLMTRYDISFTELLNIFDEYKSDRTNQVMKEIETNQTFGEREAEKLKNEDKKILEIRDIFVAEALIKDHGYKCSVVKKGPPKIWVLEKK